MVETADLDRWIHRLSLAERVNLQRRDEEAEQHQCGPRAHCSCCGGILTADGIADPYKRCTRCRAQGTRPLAKVVRLRTRRPRWRRRLP